MWNLHSLYVFTNRNFQFRSLQIFWILEQIFHDRKHEFFAVNTSTKVQSCRHLFGISTYTNIKLVLLYGSEIWRVTKANSTKLQTFVNTSHLSLLFILVLILRQFLLLQSKFLFYLITAAYKRKQLKNQTLLEIGVNNGKNIFSMGQIDQACSLLQSGCFECGKSLHNLSKFWLLKFISL